VVLWTRIELVLGELVVEGPAEVEGLRGIPSITREESEMKEHG